MIISLAPLLRKSVRNVYFWIFLHVPLSASSPHPKHAHVVQGCQYKWLFVSLCGLLKTWTCVSDTYTGPEAGKPPQQGCGSNATCNQERVTGMHADIFNLSSNKAVAPPSFKFPNVIPVTGNTDASSVNDGEQSKYTLITWSRTPSTRSNLPTAPAEHGPMLGLYPSTTPSS